MDNSSLQSPMFIPHPNAFTATKIIKYSTLIVPVKITFHWYFFVNWTSDLPKLLNLVKNVGDLKFNTQNIITDKIIGTVLYKSQNLSKKEPAPEVELLRIKLVFFIIKSLGHNTVELVVKGSMGIVNNPNKKQNKLKLLITIFDNWKQLTVNKINEIIQKIRHQNHVDNIGTQEYHHREYFGKYLSPFSQKVSA